MAATVHHLYPTPEPVGHFVRIGHTGHRILGDLHAADRFPVERAVVDPAYVADQSELLDLLHRSGVELVLDTKSAELATRGGHCGTARSLPWANPTRPHETADFASAGISECTSRIAEFAVAEGMRSVLAPTRALTRPDDPWLPIDIRSCESLRVALDECGGADISIDYPLTLTYELFRNTDALASIGRQVEQLPFDNLWIRVGGFAYSQSALGIRRFIEAARDLHSISKPIVADYIGGIAGLSFLAFGAVGGLSHGVASREGLDISAWTKPREQKGGGSAKRVYFPSLDIYLSPTEAELLFRGQGAKSLLGCNDPSCCPGGLSDMIKAPEAHFLRQRAKQIARISQVPEARRAHDFLREVVGPAEKTGAIATQLNIEDEDLAKKIAKDARRLRNVHLTLLKVHETSGNRTRALSPVRRVAEGRIVTATRRKK